MNECNVLPYSRGPTANVAATPRIATGLTQRDLNFGTQRFTPKAQIVQYEPAPCRELSWFHDDYHDPARSTSAMSHAPTAHSLQSKDSMGERVGLFSRLRTSNRNSGESLLPSTRDLKSPEPKRETSKRRLFENIRNLRSRRGTRASKPRFVYEIPTQSWDGGPSPTDYHLPAPAPNFGDIPGVGYERTAPHVDLSSGAAARAAAAAQKLLTTNMRRLEIKNERIMIRDSESGVGIESAENEPSLSAQGNRKGEPSLGLEKKETRLIHVPDPVMILPLELISHIFSYLEPQNILKCEMVSRSWHRATQTQYNWRRLYLSEYKPPDHRAFTSERPSDEEAYPETHWKSRWKAHMLLTERWMTGDASAFYMEGHSDNIYCVQFDDEKIVTGSKDRTIRVWSTRMAQCVRVLGIPTRQFNPSDMECLPEMAKPTPRNVYHSPIFTPQMTDTLPFCHSGSILCLQYDDRHMVTGSSDSSIIIWVKKSAFDFVPVQRLSRHSKGVLDVSFDNHHIVSCSKDHSICVWNRTDGNHLRTLEGHRGPVNAVRLKGELVVSASGDTVVKLWNVTSGLCIKEFSRSSRGLACVEVNLSLHKAWAGGNDHDIYEFDTEDGSVVKKLGSHADLVRSLHLDSNSGRLISASYDSTIKIFNTHGDSQNPISIRDWSASWILGAKADYRRIVATSQDRRVIVIDFGYGIENIESLDPGSYRSTASEV